MSKRRAILLGWINSGRQAQCGETVKNQHIVSQLQKHGIDVIQLDYYRWRKRPWVLLKTLGSLVFYPRTPLILSSGPKNVYPLMRLHKALRSHRPVINWVIGGNIHQLAANNVIAPKYLRSMHINIVETEEMEQGLKRLGVENVLQLPNFKSISYLPSLKKHLGRKRFVFLSRIKPEKGVDYIIESMKSLNAKGLSDAYEVDFYGRIDADYEGHFMRSVADLPNATYNGFLDLSGNAGYDTLESYDVMLFPTYWRSEGFAGIFIDCFIAGLPVIASDWAHNASLLQNGNFGFLIPPHDVSELTDKMEEIITGGIDLEALRTSCQQQAQAYDIDTVLDPATIRKIGL